MIDGEPLMEAVREAQRTRAAAWAVVSVLLLAGACPARAEPYIGLRTGRPCAECHVNITGGGMRNAHGVMYGLEQLPWSPAPPSSQDPTLFRGRINDSLYMGADLRASHDSTFESSGNANEFDDNGNLYANLDLVRSRLHLYVDEHVASGGARSREAFALLDGLPGSLYVKAGRFFPAYGWRLQDDKAFIRSATGYSFDTSDDGVEVGWTPGRLASSLAVTNGNGGAAEENQQKQVSLLSAYTSDRFRVGVSGSANKQDTDNRRLAGALAGVRIGPVVLLGEVDAGRTESATGTPPPGSISPVVRQLITYAEADWLVHPGFNLKLVHDYLDPDRSQRGDEVSRIGAGVEATPSPYVQLRLLWRRTDRPPIVRGIPFEDDREVVAELHLFL
jgi:hypothetical protein